MANLSVLMEAGTAGLEVSSEGLSDEGEIGTLETILDSMKQLVLATAELLKVIASLDNGGGWRPWPS